MVHDPEYWIQRRICPECKHEHPTIVEARECRHYVPGPRDYDDLLARADAWLNADGPPATDLYNAIGLIHDLAAALRAVSRADPVPPKVPAP